AGAAAHARGATTRRREVGLTLATRVSRPASPWSKTVDLWTRVVYSGEQWWIGRRRHAPRRIRAHDRRQEPSHASGEVPAGGRSRLRRHPRPRRLPLGLDAGELGELPRVDPREPASPEQGRPPDAAPLLLRRQ